MFVTMSPPCNQQKYPDPEQVSGEDSHSGRLSGQMQAAVNGAGDLPA
jgi:hypothetical protein